MAGVTHRALRSETTEDMLRNFIVRPASVELNALPVCSPLPVLITHCLQRRIVRAAGAIV
jgi:hypothetical protein